jgi:hypothetical protein
MTHTTRRTPWLRFVVQCYRDGLTYDAGTLIIFTLFGALLTAVGCAAVAATFLADGSFPTEQRAVVLVFGAICLFAGLCATRSALVDACPSYEQRCWQRRTGIGLDKEAKP